MAEVPGNPVQLGSRALFPRLGAAAYLAHAAISPASSRVEARVMEEVRLVAERGLGAIGVLLETAEEARTGFAALIGAHPQDVAVLANTSTAAAAIATAIPWRAGDRIVLFEDEFPANVTPWQAAGARHGLEVVHLPIAPFAESHAAGLEQVERELRRGGVRLVAVSAVQFQTGLAMPVAELGALARHYGAELFVDAIQAVGARPIDVVTSGAHYLAAGAHKWLMGQLGTAFLWVEAEAAKGLTPAVVGWTSHESPDAFLIGPASELTIDRPLRRGARVFEAGVLNHLGLAAAAAGMGPMLELGTRPIHDHVQHYHDLVEPALVELGFRSLRAAEPAARSAILALSPPRGVDAAAFSRELGELGIGTSAPCGYLRVAPHWPNSADELDAVLEAVRTALSKRS
ncbi:MAG: aminotransferase class V-fold PLP-dependent enzyme [Planctomycetaceae bacterium]|nr:aminotransferase class V-fold PLP-dependent enzyme [Planctomycetaceae bacterium]